MENNIHIVKLPSHLTDKIQPLDKCVFGPIKSCWGKKLIFHGKKQIEKSDDTRLKRTEFSALLREVWKESMLSKNKIRGFVSTGVFPVDATKFSEDLFNPK